MSNVQSIKTPKGTELPLVDLRGKPYLQVAHRLVWFREEHNDWSIQTEIIEHDIDHSLAKATIRNADGQIIATAHKQEDRQGFADHMEKCETGAIGRCLALCGYGTQFAPEIEEGGRIVDSPVSIPSRPQHTEVRKEPSPVQTSFMEDLPGVGEVREITLTVHKVAERTAKSGATYWYVDTSIGKMNSFQELEEGREYTVNVKGGEYNGQVSYSIQGL